MLSRLRTLLGGLRDSMRDDELAYGHYSRAFGVLVCLVAGLLVVLAGVMADNRPYSAAVCRELAGAATKAIKATDIELARTPEELWPLLAGELPLSKAGPESEVMCVAERVERYAALLSIDGSLFIPAYLLLTVFSLGWVLSMSVHAKTEDGRWAAPRRGLVLLLGVSALAVVATVWLDGAENRAALKVLELAGGVGALVEPLAPSLAAAAIASFEASLHKWLVTGLWAASLAALVWHQRSALAAACGNPGHWRGRTCRRLIQLIFALGTVAFLALLIGTIGGLVNESSLAPWQHKVILLGFGAVSLCGLLFSLLELLRVKARRSAC